MRKKYTINIRTKGLRKILDEMKDPEVSDEPCRFPPDVPAFCSSPDAEYLDCVNEVSMSERVYSITLLVGDSRMRYIEFDFERFKRSMKLETIETRFKILEAKCSSEVLREAIV